MTNIPGPRRKRYHEKNMTIATKQIEQTVPTMMSEVVL